MKTYIIGLQCLFLVVLTGCSGFLDEKPHSFIDGDELLSTEKGVEAALSGLYNTLNSNSSQGQDIWMWGKSMQYMTCMGTDELITSQSSLSAEASLIHVGTYDYNTESDIFSKIWFGHYLGIDRANNILSKIEQVDMNQDRREDIIAETRFFRGFFQFYLAWMYGGVPVPRQPLEDSQAPRLPLETVYDYIIEDLTHASRELPERNLFNGRINKYTAEAILAKVYLYLASCKEYRVGTNFPDLAINDFKWIDSDKMYKEAELLLTDVYTHSGYVLINPYRYLFYASTEEEARAESLFTVICSSGSENYLNLIRLWAVQGPKVCNGWVRPLNELAERYANADPRKAQNITGNIGKKTEEINGVLYGLPNPVNAQGSNACLGKIRGYVEATNGTLGVPVWASVYDWPILRFADVVLSLAEVKYKLGDEKRARDLLHEIRLRTAKDLQYPVTVSKIQYPDAESYATYLDQLYVKADFMDELLEERSRELCGEGWRRFDLIRTNRLSAVIQSIETGAGSGYWNTQRGIAQDMKNNFSDYKIWYPIPKREIEINKSLVQNWGYNSGE